MSKLGRMFLDLYDLSFGHTSADKHLPLPPTCGYLGDVFLLTRQVRDLSNGSSSFQAWIPQNAVVLHLVYGTAKGEGTKDKAVVGTFPAIRLPVHGSMGPAASVLHGLGHLNYHLPHEVPHLGCPHPHDLISQRTCPPRSPHLPLFVLQETAARDMYASLRHIHTSEAISISV